MIAAFCCALAAIAARKVKTRLILQPPSNTRPTNCHIFCMGLPKKRLNKNKLSILMASISKELNRSLASTKSLGLAMEYVWAIVLALTGTFEQLLTYVVFIGWIFYALGAAAVIALRIKRPDAARPFKVPFYPLTPILFVMAAAVIVINTIVSQPAQAAIGITAVLAGAPAYMIWRRRLLVTQA